jgi:hypothetical protein
MRQIHISWALSMRRSNSRSIRRAGAALGLVRRMTCPETRNIWCRNARDRALSSENTGFFVAL